MSQAAREFQETNPGLINTLQQQMFPGGVPVPPGEQQQGPEEGGSQQETGRAGGQEGSGRPEMDGGTKHSGGTQKGPSPDDNM